MGVDTELVWSWTGFKYCLWVKIKSSHYGPIPQPLPPANCTPQGGAFVNWQILRKKLPLPCQAAVWPDREGAGGWVPKTHTHFYTTPRFKFVIFLLYLRLI
jgi:hypothetical protein